MEHIATRPDQEFIPAILHESKSGQRGDTRKEQRVRVIEFNCAFSLRPPKYQMAK